MISSPLTRPMVRAIRSVAVVLAMSGTLALTTVDVSRVGAAVASKAWAKPCSVVSESDVEKAAGITIARVKTNAGPLKACLYYADGASAPLGIWLNDKPLTGGARTFAFDAQQAKKNSSNEGYETLSGIGDKAFFFESPVYNRIEVLLGKRLFHVDGIDLTMDQAEALARKVVANS